MSKDVMTLEEETTRVIENIWMAQSSLEKAVELLVGSRDFCAIRDVADVLVRMANISGYLIEAIKVQEDIDKSNESTADI